MSLFLKIFLWFWLAMALVVGILFLVSWSTQNEPIRRQWQTVVAESTALQTQNAKQFFENEGQAGVRTFLSRLENTERVRSAGFFVGNRLVAGKIDAESVADLIARADASDKVENQISENEAVFAERVNLKDGQPAILAVQWDRPRFPPVDWKTRILQILAAVFTTGLVCYGLALYLTSPIGKLQAAVEKMSKGDFGGQIDVKRRDELGALSRNFNLMAQRIESLINSQKTLNRDISHELRTPLARLGVALEIARSKANAADAKPYLERIEREAERINEMISRILTLSKLEVGLSNFERVRVDLSKVVEEVVADANFELTNQTKRVVIIENEKIYLEGNELLLQSAVENIVRNAVKYAPEETAVEISLTEKEMSAVIIVRDHGSGVDESQLKDLFRPFYRADESRERKSGGVGLGLAITERAVIAHHGKVSAENAVDGGLIVTIKIPLETIDSNL